jgi:hypothetical protein
MRCTWMMLGVVAVVLGGCARSKDFPTPQPWRGAQAHALGVDATLESAASARTATQWLQAAADRYRALATYEERGTVTTAEAGDDRIALAVWNLRFSRAGGYQFRYDQHGLLGMYITSRAAGAGRPLLNNQRFSYSIWKSPDEPLARSTWTVGERDVRELELPKAIAGAFGVTGMTSGWAINMLTGDFALRQGALELADATLAGGATVDGNSCAVVQGTRTTGANAQRVRVFIDMQTSLVRRWEFEEAGPPMRLTMWSVVPRSDVSLGADAFVKPEQNVWEDQFGVLPIETE